MRKPCKARRGVHGGVMEEMKMFLRGIFAADIPEEGDYHEFL
jgi:hypothetical protein